MRRARGNTANNERSNSSNFGNFLENRRRRQRHTAQPGGPPLSNARGDKSRTTCGDASRITGSAPATQTAQFVRGRQPRSTYTNLCTEILLHCFLRYIARPYTALRTTLDFIRVEFSHSLFYTHVRRLSHLLEKRVS